MLKKLIRFLLALTLTFKLLQTITPIESSRRKIETSSHTPIVEIYFKNSFIRFPDLEGLTVYSLQKAYDTVRCTGLYQNKVLKTVGHCLDLEDIYLELSHDGIIRKPNSYNNLFDIKEAYTYTNNGEADFFGCDKNLPLDKIGTEGNECFEKKRIQIIGKNFQGEIIIGIEVDSTQAEIAYENLVIFDKSHPNIINRGDSGTPVYVVNDKGQNIIIGCLKSFVILNQDLRELHRLYQLEKRWGYSGKIYRQIMSEIIYMGGFSEDRYYQFLKISN